MTATDVDQSADQRQRARRTIGIVAAVLVVAGVLYVGLPIPGLPNLPGPPDRWDGGVSGGIDDLAVGQSIIAMVDVLDGDVDVTEVQLTVDPPNAAYGTLVTCDGETSVGIVRFEPPFTTDCSWSSIEGRTLRADDEVFLLVTSLSDEHFEVTAVEVTHRRGWWHRTETMEMSLHGNMPLEDD